MIGRAALFCNCWYILSVQITGKAWSAERAWSPNCLPAWGPWWHNKGKTRWWPPPWRRRSPPWRSRYRRPSTGLQGVKPSTQSYPGWKIDVWHLCICRSCIFFLRAHEQLQQKASGLQLQVGFFSSQSCLTSRVSRLELWKKPWKRRIVAWGGRN